GIDLEIEGGGEAGLFQGTHITFVAIEKLGVGAGGAAEKRNAPVAEAHQVAGHFIGALEVVGTDGGTGLAGLYGAPTHEMGALLYQALEAQAILEKITIPQQNEAVGLAAVFV